MIETFRCCRLQAPRRRAGGLILCGKVFCALGAIVLACGCSSGARERRDAKSSLRGLPSDRELGETLVNTPFEQQIGAGAVTDRTLYDHHFAGDGVSLNILGERRIENLLEVATDQPVIVNVQDNGNHKDGVHEARVAVVRERMLAAGLDEKQLQIVSTPPGGPGRSTESIIRELATEQAGGGEPAAQGASTTVQPPSFGGR